MKKLSVLSIVAVLLLVAPIVTTAQEPPACNGLMNALENIPPDSPGYQRVMELAERNECVYAREHAALVALYLNTDGDNDWTNNDGWDDLTSNHCDWYGVTCSEVTEGRVTQLNLNVNVVFPTAPYPWDRPIPAELGYLTELTILNLQAMYLTGSVPASLGDLVNLETLNLQANRLGTIDEPAIIPDALTNMGSATYDGVPLTVLFWVNGNPGASHLCWESEVGYNWATGGNGPTYYDGPGVCPAP